MLTEDEHRTLENLDITVDKGNAVKNALVAMGLMVWGEWLLESD